MKKWLIWVLFILLALVPTALCEESDQWRTAPVITTAYELSSGQLYLEWEGYAPVYQVYMDGKSVANVIVSNAVLPIKAGTHTISVYPINEAKSADTKVEIGIEGNNIIGGNLNLDLAALGLDPKNLTAGTPSASLSVDYIADPIFSSAPDELAAITDFEDRVLLSFSDRQHADEYLVTIKIGSDVNYVTFSAADSELVSKTNTAVVLTLDQEYLQNQECLIPELDEKYTFSVQLRKYADNMLTGESVKSVIHTSKESRSLSYVPTAAWKTAPEITYASQTADGQITLQWTHDDNGLGCEYAVMKINKTMGIKTGEAEIAATADKSFIINDLMNGSHSYAIVPLLNGEKGAASAEAAIDLRNDWVVAPALTCEQTDSGAVRLTWEAAEGIESYHISAYKGDNHSFLRFVNLDYSLYAEFDIPAAPGSMNFDFAYDGEIDPAVGERFKFEICGVRHTAENEEQKSAVSVQSIVIR